MKFRKNIAATLLMSALMLTLSACDRDGPLEDAGEEIDESFEDAGDTFEDSTDGN